MIPILGVAERRVGQPLTLNGLFGRRFSGGGAIATYRNFTITPNMPLRLPLGSLTILIQSSKITEL
ncbi:MAG: hypothetical protein AAFY78_00780 [Cyanobacteria bacterium J06648_16]